MRLIAGGYWNNGTNCRSQSRNANNYRWNTNTNIGARFASDTGFCERNSWLDLLALSCQAGQNTQRRVWGNQ
jgi:hypothetical protein